MSDLIDVSDTAGTLVERVIATIRQRIAARELPPSAKLPSIRGFAESMKVSKSTVVEAYDRLAAEGIIQSRRGSGFYVAGHLQPLSLTGIGPRLDRAIDPLWVSRQSLEADETVLKPGCGWLPPSWMPTESLRRAMRGLTKASDATLTDYGTPLGLAPLRQLLARRLAENGVEAAPEQIVLTESGTQAIDLLCRFLIEPGDTVLVDDPSYFTFHALLRAHRATIVSVPYTPAGPDIAVFAKALAEHRPRLYITNSGLHNPTGATLSAITAHKVLKLAAQHDLIIAEDDIFADFEHEPGPRLAAFDGLERVVQVGSFSKTLTASIRCGYIAARRDWIDDLADLKIATTFGGGHLSTALLLAVLKDGTYRKHVQALRTKLAKEMQKTSTQLQSLGLKPWVEPKAGMFLWCRLPGTLDAADIARQALAEDIVLAPGNAFSLSQSARSYLRFNVAQSSDPRIARFLKKALRS